MKDEFDKKIYRNISSIKTVRIVTFLFIIFNMIYLLFNKFKIKETIL